MSDLDHLPLEILAEILSHLPNTDLACVCRVSRQMHAVSQRVLYTAPSLISTYRSNPPSLQRLLRTLLSPGGDTLAGHVRSLSVLWDNVASNDTQFPADMALFAAAGARLHLTDSVLKPNTQFVLLLHLLPRLQVLELAPPDDYNAVSSFLQTAHAPLLHQLREFRQHPTHKYTNMRTPTIHGLLRLPALRIIDVCTTSWPGRAFHTAAAPTAPGTSTIRSLCLRNSSLSPATLHEILILPTALTYFSFSPIVFHNDFDMSSFSLAPLRETLKHLHINLWGLPLNTEPGDRIRGTIGSLRDWPVLHTVRCPLTCLLGEGRHEGGVRLAEVLPTGLRNLEIQDDTYWPVKKRVGKVLEMVHEKERMLPGLEQLVMSVGRSGGRLREACRVAKVVLVVRRLWEVDAPQRPVRVQAVRCQRGTRRTLGLGP